MVKLLFWWASGEGSNAEDAPGRKKSKTAAVHDTPMTFLAIGKLEGLRRRGET